MRNLTQILITLAMITVSSYSYAQCGGPTPLLCDADGNRAIDIDDITAISLAKGTAAAPGDVRDIDMDGVITVLDARQCAVICDLPECLDYADRSSARLAAGADLLSGPLARGVPGDFVLENAHLRVIIQKAGRQWLSIGTFGGNIIDVSRKDAAGGLLPDHMEEFVIGLNIENTANYTDVRIERDGSDGQSAMICATGPDDLLELANASSAIRDFGASLPASAWRSSAAWATGLRAASSRSTARLTHWRRTTRRAASRAISTAGGSASTTWPGTSAAAWRPSSRVRTWCASFRGSQLRLWQAS